MMIKDFLAVITFLDLGQKKCPLCGMIGESVKADFGRGDVKFFRCPGCATEFIREFIINLGKSDVDVLKNN